MPGSATDVDVVIAGGGIGGLTLALALHSAGIDCTVLEAAAEIRPLGVGINLLPHAVRVLSDLDLADRLAERAVATAELTYFNRHGQRIWTEPRGRDAGYRHPQFSMHRGALQMALLEAVRERAGADRVITGRAVDAFRVLEGRVTVTLAEGRNGRPAGEIAGKMLVGADGSTPPCAAGSTRARAARGTPDACCGGRSPARSRF